MTTIIIYPDNTALVDGNIVNDTAELFKRYGVKAVRRGNPDQARHVTVDGVRLCVFPQPVEQTRQNISQALRTSETLTAQRQRTLEQYRAVFAEYQRLRSSGLSHISACKKLVEMWTWTERHINKIVAAQMRGEQ